VPEGGKKIAKIESIHLGRTDQLAELMRRLGVDEGGVEKMVPKGFWRVFLLRDISAGAANILKQEALAVGAECATPRQVVTGKPECCDALLMGDLSRLNLLGKKLAGQPLGLSALGDEIVRMVENYLQGEGFIWRIKEQVLDFSTGPKIMGVINLTPDSFSDGGKYATVDDAVKRAQEMVAEGAEIIDVGGVSTRPGSSAPNEEEEWTRLLGFFERADDISAPLSVDTYRSGIAERAVGCGAEVVNDTTALRADPRMAPFCAEAGVGVVLMHMQGEPTDMQKNPQYENVVGEILAFLKERLAELTESGIEEERMAVDVGIGFGKTLEHNLALLGGLSAFCELGRPIVVGASRKSFIGKLLDLEMGDRVLPSVVAAVISAERGAAILRVHDVAETAIAFKLLTACRQAYVREALGGGGRV